MATAQVTFDYSNTRPVAPIKLYGDKIQERFEAFNKVNPKVYTKLVELARQVKGTGVHKYGIAGLYERLRWHYSFEMKHTGKDRGIKLPNNFRSRYARLIMKREPDLADFFTIAKLTTEKT